MLGLETPRIATGQTAYVRFHGGEGRYRGRYSEERLLDWANWMLDQARQSRTVWAFFNNDIDGYAVQDALTLKAIVAQCVSSAR